MACILGLSRASHAPVTRQSLKAKEVVDGQNRKVEE
jgi:hypothetical protein